LYWPQSGAEGQGCAPGAWHIGQRGRRPENHADDAEIRSAEVSGCSCRSRAEESVSGMQMSASSSFLKVDGIRKAYAAPGGTTTALNGVSLEIDRCSFVSIIGPSGCGKSTLLQIMAGLVTPTSGEVLVDGRVVKGPPPNALYVFQQYTRSLFPWKSVQANVAFGLENRERLSRREIERQTSDIIKLVRLEGFENHYPWQLSGGMQQRVAIARALV